VTVAATVLIPTFDHGQLLEYSLASARAQTVTDIEIFIVGDGAPDITRDIARRATAADPRVRYFDNPKGASRGELHRHRALAEASGAIVCYLADDDLWLPQHVQTMRALLAGHDFANTLPLAVYPGDELRAGTPVDLALPFDRECIVKRRNKIGNSFAAHTLAFYRGLPHGWRPAPAGMFSDHYMWRQILSQPGCRAVSGHRPTAINFASRPRRGMAIEERAAELRRWLARINDPDWLAGLEAEVLQCVARARAAEAATWQEQLDGLYASAWWRLGAALRAPLRRFRRR